MCVAFIETNISTRGEDAARLEALHQAVTAIRAELQIDLTLETNRSGLAIVMFLTISEAALRDIAAMAERGAWLI